MIRCGEETVIAGKPAVTPHAHWMAEPLAILADVGRYDAKYSDEQRNSGIPSSK